MHAPTNPLPLGALAPTAPAKSAPMVTATPSRTPRRTQAYQSTDLSVQDLERTYVPVPMNHLDLVLCDRPVRGPILPSRSSIYDTSLYLNPVPEVLCCKNWVEFITRFHHLVGSGIILQKPAVCYIVPVDVHSLLPQYSQSQEFGNYHPDPDPDPD